MIQLPAVSRLLESGAPRINSLWGTFNKGY